jgi:hypothetical protein
VGCRYAIERRDVWLYQRDGVVSGFMASSAIARGSTGSWIGATALANSDATIEIVNLVRDIIAINKCSANRAQIDDAQIARCGSLNEDRQQKRRSRTQ